MILSDLDDAFSYQCLAISASVDDVAVKYCKDPLGQTPVVTHFLCTKAYINVKWSHFKQIQVTEGE